MGLLIDSILLSQFKIILIWSFIFNYFYWNLSIILTLILSLCLIDTSRIQFQLKRWKRQLFYIQQKYNFRLSRTNLFILLIFFINFDLFLKFEIYLAW